MKALKWALLIAALLVVPLMLLKKTRPSPPSFDESLRYDIDDYVADQGL